MYEQHFGLSGHPFAATPDPDFYFDSAGHHRALAYLRHAVREGECFIVMTGDIGAGKTTLLHTLLRGLDADAIVPALLAGTRLDARALLVAVLSGLHGDASGTSLDALRAHLRAVLAGLTSTGRRALIVVDEAQHLLPDAIAELTALAQLQSSHGAALQVLLCGEPALRRTLQGTPAAALRQPVFLFCDVGLLDPMETRAYIEHRLSHVGWAGSPAFADDAHDRIHAATDGVPRRINRLCDRLLMAAYQLELDTVSAELVARTTAELHEEIGGLGAAPPAAAEAPRFAPAPSGSGGGGEPAVASAPGIIPALFSVAADAAPMTSPPAAVLPPAPTPPAAQEPATPAHAASSASSVRAPQAAEPLPVIEDTEPEPVFAAAPSHEPVSDSVRVHHHGAGARWAAASVVLVAALSAAWWAYRREPASPAGATAPRAAVGTVTNQRERDSATERARSRELADIAPGTVGAPSAGPSMPAAASDTPAPQAVPAPQPALPSVRSAQSEERRIEPAPAARPVRRPAPRAQRADTEAAVTGTRSRAADGVAPQPAPAPGPCTAAVAALGLCNPTKNP